MALVTHHAIVSNLDMGPAVLPMGPDGFHGGVSAVGAHRAARGDRTAADALRHAGDFLREPAEAAAGHPPGAADILLAPPRMWERIYSTICTELRKRPALARKAFYGALGMALAAARYRREGKPVPARIRGPLKLADRLMFRKVRARFGGRLRVAAIGRRAAEQRSGRVLRGHRHAAGGRLRADRGRRGSAQPARHARARAASASRCPASRSRWRTTARC